MRPAMILLPLLLLGGCSCQRHADDGGTHGAAAAADGKRAAPTAAGDGNAALAAIAVPVLSAVPAGADDEATVVRHYFNALARGDRAAADALWTGGRVSTRADDAALRALIQRRQHQQREQRRRNNPADHHRRQRQSGSNGFRGRGKIPS